MNIKNFNTFCGGEFWNINLTWDTRNLLKGNNTAPDFTSCFQNSVLIWAPCGFLWLLLPFYVYSLYNRTVKLKIITINTFNITKTVVSLLTVFVVLLDVFKYFSEDSSGEDPTTILLVSPIVLAATLILATVMIQVDRVMGVSASGVMFLFYLLLTVAGIVPFYSKILGYITDDHMKDEYRFVTFYVYYGLVLINIVLSCITDEVTRTDLGQKPCPEVYASFLSYISFWWMNKLVFMGYKKTLTADDMFELHPRDVTRNNSPFFEKRLNKELHFVRERLKDKMTQDNIENNMSTNITYDRARLIDKETSEQKKNGKEENKKERHNRPVPSLFKVIASCHGTTFLKAWLCKAVCDLLTFIEPILQGQLITYTETKYAEKWKGYILAASFLLFAILNVAFFHQQFHIAMSLGMRVKACIVATVFKKALTMSNEARKEATVGEIVNLMSVDAQRIQDVAGYLWMVWSAPLQISIALYLLYGVLQEAVFAGVTIMILLIPFNTIIANKMTSYQVEQLKYRDQRIKLMNELLNGIKVLKLYAWEPTFQNKVKSIRDKEMRIIKKNAYLRAFSMFSWTCAPFMVTLATFATYVLMKDGNILDANKAFVSLSLFNILRFPINMLPLMVGYLVQAKVSLGRLSNFLSHEDLDLDSVQHNPNEEFPVVIGRKGTFSWHKQGNPILKEIDLKLPDGSLTAVVGQVGAGKSSLISALLGEMHKLSGRVNVRGSVAYVAQQAWIQNAKVKENILFGSEEDQERYNKVIEACALGPDLDIFPGGDQTEIGEKGINLSGGQKQRVSLARAVYNDSDIYYLDDPLSAVDSHVGKHIFDKVISDKGLLKGKTRLLVTHGIHWLPMVDRIIVIVDGRISEAGSYDELLSHNGDFAQFLKTYLLQEEEAGESDDDDPDILQIRERILQQVDSVISDDPTTDDEDRKKIKRLVSRTSASEVDVYSDQEEKCKMRHRTRHQISRKESEKEAVDKYLKESEGERLTTVETAETGNVKLSVFMNYAIAVGRVASPMMLFLLSLYQAGEIFGNVWLSKWTADSDLKTLNGTAGLDKQKDYLAVYGATGAGQALMVMFYSITSAVFMVKASRLLHQKMLSNMLRSPMSFFDTTPSGRIVNRFSQDVASIDDELPSIIEEFLQMILSVLSTVIVISYATPVFLAVMLPLLVLYYSIQRFYIPTSRQLKRIESTTRSPIYSHFSETITGSSTIKAFGQMNRFIKESEKRVDHNLAFYFGGITANRWIGLRVELLGSLVVFAAALLSVLGKSSDGGRLTGSLVGLSITYALEITESLNWLVRMTSALETNIVSVERVKEYSETPSEAAWDIQDTHLPDNWPEKGAVKFNSYSTRYREGLDLVLKGITFRINSAEKVGIVGRTGAGKSSLTLSLFRLIEAAGGNIMIDDINIADIGLHQLRSKLTILPQDPVLFSGTLRDNLDPINEYGDDQLWSSLEHSHLRDYARGLDDGLDHEVGEGGQNLSVGQRQLICLARSLLHKSKILILDEATAAVDLETDDLIQNTIRTEFADCTVITIAHRLNTIMDNDRIMVLENGELKEFDSPSNLLRDKNSVFYGMAKESNLV